MSKTISQKDWKRGVVANTPDQDQPKGSLPRASNLIYTRRGGLRACDGSQIISLQNGALQPVSGPWTDLYLFKPINVNSYYIGIKKEFSTHLGVPVATASDAGAGGSLLAGTYRYKVTTLDGAGGEGTASAETSVTIVANHLIGVSWPAIPNAGNGGYKIYRAAVNGASNTETLLATVGTGNTTYQDNGSVAPDGVTFPPAIDTTQVCILYRVPATSYGAGNVLATFPADPFVPNDGTPGGSGGGGGTGGNSSPPSGGAPPTPSGGNTGNCSPLPQIVQFANKAFIALGNGFAPQLLTDPSTVAAISNTFTATYPDWVASTAFSTGDQIKPSTNNAGGFVFKAVQGGTTGTVNPTFPQTANQTVADKTVIWQNIGQGTTSPAPRGAAHVEVYAGALWAANTSPTTTADNLDGPSALRMSDINNPTSWNPLNTAFLDRDDGDQITGLKAMTIAESGIPPTGSLVAFKNFKTFQVNGVFGSSSFSIQRAQTDLGCIAPRTIEFCPGFGIIRLSHLGFALFDTTRDRIISEDIRPFLFPDPNIPDILPVDWNFGYLAKAAQTAMPPMYCCAVPLALPNLPLSNTPGGVLLQAGLGTSAWTVPQLYYFRATKFTTVNGVVTESSIGVEVSLYLTQTGLLKTVPSVIGGADATAVKYRVYAGTISGAYSNYAELTPAQMQAGRNFLSIADFPNAGGITTGVGGLTRLLCYDLVQKCWAVIDLPWAIEELTQVRPLGSIPITVTGGFADGSVRRLQSGDATWDGTPVAWNFRPAELMAGGGTSRVFYQRLTLKGVGTPTSVLVTPSYDYVDDIQQAPINYTFGGGRFLSWLDLLQTALTAHATVSGTGPVEIDALDWEVEVLEEGVPPQFA